MRATISFVYVGKLQFGRIRYFVIRVRTELKFEPVSAGVLDDGYSVKPLGTRRLAVKGLPSISRRSVTFGTA